MLVVAIVVWLAGAAFTVGSFSDDHMGAVDWLMALFIGAVWPAVWPMLFVIAALVAIGKLGRRLDLVMRIATRL